MADERRRRRHGRIVERSGGFGAKYRGVWLGTFDSEAEAEAEIQRVVALDDRRKRQREARKKRAAERRAERDGSSAPTETDRPAEDRPAVLYRMFGADGELLYIGMSTTRMRRFFEHQRSKDWFTEVARLELEHFASAFEASWAERAAIHTEDPRENRRSARAVLVTEDRIRRCRDCGTTYRVKDRAERQRLTLCDPCLYASEKAAAGA